MSSVEITPRQLAERFEALDSELKVAAVKRVALAVGHVVEAYAKVNANEVFERPTSNLAGSICVIEGKAEERKATVSVGPTALHGRIHELGGTILPVEAKVLHWVNDQGEDVFANVVHLPARPYLRPAVNDHLDEIGKAAGMAIHETLVEVFK